MGEAQPTDEAAPAGAPARRRVSGWLIAAVAVVAALASGIAILTASDGLGTGARQGAAEFTVGDTITSAETTLTVERVAVVDDLPWSGLYPDESSGERVLAVLVEATNLDTEPRATSDTGSLQDIRLENRPEDMPSITVYGDEDFSLVTLQPHVPATILLSWVVAADEIVAGGDVRLVIPDAEKLDSTLFRGESLWSPLDPVGTVSARPEDLGAGAGDGSL